MHDINPPGGFPVADDQGQFPTCPEHSIAKAMANG